MRLHYLKILSPVVVLSAKRKATMYLPGPQKEAAADPRPSALSLSPFAPATCPRSPTAFAAAGVIMVLPFWAARFRAGPFQAQNLDLPG